MSETNSDVSNVIDGVDHIENLINQIIHNYLSPRKEAFEFVWHVVLDSSIMSLGAKIKLVVAISKKLEIKIDRNALHQVGALRNAFAHHGLRSHPTMSVGKTPEEDESYYVLQILTNGGELKRIRREEALEEFKKYYRSSLDSLMPLQKMTKEILQKSRE